MRVVCVTGASGFLGSWVLKLCLEEGWKVRATTRSPEKHRERLISLVPKGQRAEDVLEIVALDLLDGDDSSFDNAVKGCDACFHTASPFFIVGSTRDNVVKPAVEGTRKVLKAVQRNGIKDVVLTSSTAAIYAYFGKFPIEHVMTENDWYVHYIYLIFCSVIPHIFFYISFAGRMKTPSLKTRRGTRLAKPKPRNSRGRCLRMAPRFGSQCAILA